MSLQKPMNDVIDRGDSPIQQLYFNKTVFVTGGCGFIGKQLIEKLLRACKIKKIYVLVRPKKSKTIQERISATLSNNVFDTLRKKDPNFAERIVPVEGDVENLNLGLSNDDWQLLAQEVNIIFNAAATTRFDGSLRYATLINVRGTREVLKLATSCYNLINFVHISTAFAHATKERINKQVLDDFYPCPVPPSTMISLAENIDENRLDSITNHLIDGWPNTYTFTKAIAEELVRTTAGDLPVCIVRPPIAAASRHKFFEMILGKVRITNISVIKNRQKKGLRKSNFSVISSYYEPTPGWLDFSTLASSSGVYLAVSLGITKVICVDERIHLSMAPVDFVNNAIIASVWDSTEQRKIGSKIISVYTITRKDMFKWNDLGYNMRYHCADINTPKALWFCGVLETKRKYLYVILVFLFHYVPAFFLDVICTILGKKPKGINSFIDIYSKIDKLSQAYYYFSINEWDFRDANVQVMIKRMSSADQAIFNCDMSSINIKEYVRVWLIGLRKFVIKDGLQNSAEGSRKQKVYGIYHVIYLTVYLSALWWIFKILFNLLIITVYHL